MGPELCNYAFALLFLTFRYPATFWYTSRPMALIFCCMMIVANLHLLFETAAVAVLYKVSYNRQLIPGLTMRLVLPPSACLALPAVGTVLTIVGQMAIFEYGYAQFLDNLRKYRQYFASSRDMFEFSSLEEEHTTERDRFACLTGYLPHLGAIMMMVLIVIFKAPVVFEMIQVYRHTGDKLCLTSVIMLVIYLSVWIFLWVVFTFKSMWKFQINIPIQTVSEITPQSTVGTGSKLNPDDPPIYTCFHPAPPMPDHQSSTDCCSEHSSSKNSSERGGTNYVYLQSAIAPPALIPTISEHVDVVSESSYESRGGGSGSGGTAGSVDVPDCPPTDPGPPGLLKYAVRRGSTGQASLGTTSSFGAGSGNVNFPTGSLQRNGRMRKSQNRVTFKEEHETIPGSPLSEGEGSSQNTSSTSDSGIERAQGREDALRNSYNEPTYLNQADFANYSDVYGNTTIDGLGSQSHPPDVVSSPVDPQMRQFASPYSSLTRSNRSVIGHHMDDIEMHSTSEGDPQLCSQV